MTYIEKEKRSPLIGAYEVTYFGKQAHAAAHPWDGRSAFDALQIAFYGVELLRKHLNPLSVHVIYDQIDSGDSPANVVPVCATAWFYLCCMGGEPELAANASRLERILQGAALMTGTKAECRMRYTYAGEDGKDAASPLVKKIYKAAAAL